MNKQEKPKTNTDLIDTDRMILEDNQYRDLVFKYMDRMIDPCECDSLEEVIDEYYQDFLKIDEVKEMMEQAEVEELMKQ